MRITEKWREAHYHWACNDHDNPQKQFESYAGCTTCGDESARWRGKRAESYARRHAEKHKHKVWFCLLGWRDGSFDGR